MFILPWQRFIMDLIITNNGHASFCSFTAVIYGVIIIMIKTSYNNVISGIFVRILKPGLRLHLAQITYQFFSYNVHLVQSTLDQFMCFTFLFLFILKNIVLKNPEDPHCTIIALSTILTVAQKAFLVPLIQQFTHISIQQWVVGPINVCPIMTRSLFKVRNYYNLLHLLFGVLYWIKKKT